MEAIVVGYRSFVDKKGVQRNIYSCIVPFSNYERRSSVCQGSTVKEYWSDVIFDGISTSDKVDLVFEPDGNICRLVGMTKKER